MFLFSLNQCTSRVCSSGKLKFPRTYIEGTETKFLQSDLASHAEIDVGSTQKGSSRLRAFCGYNHVVNWTFLHHFLILPFQFSHPLIKMEFHDCHLYFDDFVKGMSLFINIICI